MYIRKYIRLWYIVYPHIPILFKKIFKNNEITPCNSNRYRL